MNYVTDAFGVVHQDPPIVTKEYTAEYIEEAYASMPERVEMMSWLRTGFVIGAIGIPASVLDVGYGNGGFLKAMQSLGSLCYGCDISGYPLPEGCEELSWPEVLDSRFALVTFFDSLEHIESLEFLSQLKAERVVITAPYYREEAFPTWKHRKPGEHLHHFTPESLKRLMEHMGFSRVKTVDLEDCIRGRLDGQQNTFTSIFLPEEF